MHVVLLSSDLMLVSSTQGMADRHRVELRIAATPAQAAPLAADAAVIAIDLRTPGLDIAALVPQLRELVAPQALVIAFGPHVHTEALQAAAAAGCDEVITRGQFERRFDVLLNGITAQGAPDR